MENHLITEFRECIRLTGDCPVPYHPAFFAEELEKTNLNMPSYL
jgi:hypothetical protein